MYTISREGDRRPACFNVLTYVNIKILEHYLVNLTNLYLEVIHVLILTLLIFIPESDNYNIYITLIRMDGVHN